MPAQVQFVKKTCAAVALAVAVVGGMSVDAAAQSAAAASAPAFVNSDLDARLFYELIIGELELGAGDPGAGFGVVLDAAKKSNNEQLFRHAADIALQARAGEQALEAAKAWRAAQPQSLEAHRYVVQLLVALNKVAETAEPLRSLLKLTPVIERPPTIAALPGLYSRADDHKAAASVLEQVLKPYVDAVPTSAASRVAIGRAWLIANEPARALLEAETAAAQDPTAEAPAQLALEMMSTTPSAENVVQQHLKAKPDSANVRLLYARVLSGQQRYADAITQLDAVTHDQPELPAPWLTLGALRLEQQQPKDAVQALQRYVELATRTPAEGAAVPPGAAPSVLADGDVLGAPDSALVQAYLMLAQATEMTGDDAASSAWLDKIDDGPKHALEVQVRRASLLAKQGKLDEARALIRSAPERTEADARTKIFAEVAVLRDAKDWAAAYKVLEDANRAYPEDPDLLYEQSMMAEKLNRPDETERLLRHVIAIKPDHPQAHNALGYSLAERNQRLPEAKALIEKALVLSPGEPFITDSLGWVEFRMGHSDEALRLLRGAYQLRPDPEIAAHLGEVLWVNGKRDEARRVLREGRERDAGNDVLRETVARLRVDL